MPKNAFVLGTDELNRATLRMLRDASQYRFHQLLTVEELQGDTIPLAELLDRAQAQLEEFDDTVDAVVGYWPVSASWPGWARRPVSSSAITRRAPTWR